MVLNVPPRRFALVSLVALSLGACATGMSAEDCASADWTALGEADGRSGAPMDGFLRKQERCAAFGLAPDSAAYEAGRARGLDAYCTPEGGWEAGRAGGVYRGVCPADRESAFLDEFGLGARLYQYTSAYDEAAAAYEEAVADLDQHRRDLARAERRYDGGQLSTEGREKARQDIDYHRRSIDRLVEDLPLLRIDLDRARDALDDYRATLRRVGR